MLTPPSATTTTVLDRSADPATCNAKRLELAGLSPDLADSLPAMPWCEPCDKFYNPGTADGDVCPDCGETLQVGDVAHAHAEAHPPVKVPWHFWVAVTAMVIYLGWRFIEGIIWAIF